MVGEVETFNYPRFVLEGFQFLGFGEGSINNGDGDGGVSEAFGEAVRMYTLQTRCGIDANIDTINLQCCGPHTLWHPCLQLIRKPDEQSIQMCLLVGCWLHTEQQSRGCFEYSGVSYVIVACRWR